MTAVDPWSALRSVTRARVGLGRAGDAIPTSRVLELAADHALARDAVHDALDVEALRADLDGVARLVRSAAPDRATYLQRPDLGRRLAPGTELERTGADLVLVLADGLSARAVQTHAASMVKALLPMLSGVVEIVIATQARVALGDGIADRIGAAASIVLIGERPGLTSPDSLGAYLTWAPAPGKRDSERNCVSNIRPPHGLGYAAAAETLVRLLTASRALGASGVVLKDDGRALP